MEKENLHARDLIKSRDEMKVVFDEFDEGIRFVIMSLYSHFTAYVGIPSDHPLAGFDYDDVPLSAHYGLTYSDYGGKHLPKGYYWYGWDYTHAGDYHYPGEKMIKENPDLFKKGADEKDWTLGEVKKDSWETIYEFKKLVKIAEKIDNKSNL